MKSRWLVASRVAWTQSALTEWKHRRRWKTWWFPSVAWRFSKTTDAWTLPLVERVSPPSVQAPELRLLLDSIPPSALIEFAVIRLWLVSLLEILRKIVPHQIFSFMCRKFIISSQPYHFIALNSSTILYILTVFVFQRVPSLLSVANAKQGNHDTPQKLHFMVSVLVENRHIEHRRHVLDVAACEKQKIVSSIQRYVKFACLLTT